MLIMLQRKSSNCWSLHRESPKHRSDFEIKPFCLVYDPCIKRKEYISKSLQTVKHHLTASSEYYHINFAKIIVLYKLAATVTIDT